MNVRLSAVNQISLFLEQNQSERTKLISDVYTTGDAASYLQNMRADGTWADDLVTGATASFLVAKINVYTKNLKNGEWSLKSTLQKMTGKVMKIQI